jgi:GTP-binding protein EngB required for normal cell division
MDNRINNLISVANLLKDSGSKALLEKWQKDLQTKNRSLPFIGRFSAGKSSLINKLLKDHILPTARVETTAALTRISYSEAISARLSFSDGSGREISINEVTNFNHSNMGESELEVSSIDVGIPLDILKSGLTIVDSPGMDTIVNNHVTLAQYLMNEAVLTVYVIAGSPSDFDLGIISQLLENGVEVIVVRTHMDSIKTEEESYADVMQNDESILAKSGCKLRYFAISNDANPSAAASAELNRFEDYLRNEVAAKIDTVYNSRLAKRLDKMSADFKKQLLAQRELINNSRQKSDAQLDAEISSIDKAKKRIEDVIDSLQQQLTKEKSSVRQSISYDIEDCQTNSISRFKKELTRVLDAAPASGQQKDNLISDLFQSSLANTSKEISDLVTENISKWAAKSAKTIQTDFKEVSENLGKLNVNFDPDFDLSRVEEIADRQESLMEKLEFISSQVAEMDSFTDARLAELGTKRETIEKTLQELNAAHKEAVDAIAHLNNNYQPRYITKPSKMGNLLRKIGNVADMAMLAIPAIGWEKGANMLAAKAASMAGKGGAIAMAGQKLLTAGSNVAKVIASTDTTKDVITIVDMATKQITANTEAADSGNALTTIPANANNLICKPENTSGSKSIFDYLSLSHWFGKFGEWIDPPKTEIDMEYENRYRQAKDACQYQAFMIARRRLDEERELGRIKDEAHAKEIENKFRKDALAREEEQYKKELKSLELKRQKAIRTATIEAAASQYKDAVAKIDRHVTANLNDILDTVYLQVLAAASQSSYEQLENTRQHLEELRKRKDANHDGEASSLKEIDSLITMLN